MLVKVNWEVIEVFLNIPLHLLLFFTCSSLHDFCSQEFTAASLAVGGASTQFVVTHCCVAQAASSCAQD